MKLENWTPPLQCFKHLKNWITVSEKTESALALSKGTVPGTFCRTGAAPACRGSPPPARRTASGWRRPRGSPSCPAPASRSCRPARPATRRGTSPEGVGFRVCLYSLDYTIQQRKLYSRAERKSNAVTFVISVISPHRQSCTYITEHRIITCSAIQ